MMSSVTSVVLMVAVSQVVGELSPAPDEPELLTLATGAVKEVLSAVSGPQCSILLLTDGATSSTAVFQVIQQLHIPGGVGVMEGVVNDQTHNITHGNICNTIVQARQLRQVSWCVTVVVVSDSTVFLNTFAECSLKVRLLVWSTRLLAVTRLQLPQLHQLHKTFSMTNSMLLIVDNNFEKLKCNVYIYLPYSSGNTQTVRVASWTLENRLSMRSNFQLFPEKFSRFTHGPSVRAAMVDSPYSIAYMKEDPRAPAGKVLWFKGFLVQVLDYIAHSINFTYSFVTPADGSSGSINSDGRWSGIVGMLMREEADLSGCPLTVTASRSQVLDMTLPLSWSYLTVIGSLGRPEIDPWGFVLPFTPLVWLIVFISMFIMMAAMLALSSLPRIKSPRTGTWLDKSFNFIKILLQQDFKVVGLWLWWERVVWLVWLLVNLLLSRSYSGNLVSYLAVRYIPKHFPTLQDFLDDPSAKLIWQRDSSTEEYIRSRGYSLLAELADLEKEDRVVREAVTDLGNSIEPLVKPGKHMLLFFDELLYDFLGDEFSKSGQCDYYFLNLKFKPSMTAMMVSKNNPLLLPINEKVLTITQFGLYDHWVNAANPNNTACHKSPTKLSVSTTLSVGNLWGIFVVVSGGVIAALVTFGLEILSDRYLRS